MYIDYLDSPPGSIEIQASEQGITQVNFVDTPTQTINPNAHTAACKQQLQEYFAGTRREFKLALDAQGTDFQQQVWQQLQTISFGSSCSYQDIADALHNPKAVRAVGAANGKNPIAIIVPCHRVIGSNGTLTGYAGGLERKAWLLEHEGLRFKAETERNPSQLAFNL
jgi:methylated-DNA-[protein]-cysteine S-methyltransferase